MDYKDWEPINQRLKEVQDTDRRRRDLQATADFAANELATIPGVVAESLRTIDGVKIRVGMRVVDYNLDWTTVQGIQSIELSGNVWWKCGTGMFDGQRLWARMP
jgi:hypothetical protein